MINKKLALKLLKQIKRYDKKHFLKSPSSPITEMPQKPWGKDLDYINQNFYTLKPEPEAGKKLAFLKKPIFKLLFTYSFRQVIFNEHLKNLLNNFSDKLNKQDQLITSLSDKLNKQDQLIIGNNKHNKSTSQNTDTSTEQFRLIAELNIRNNALEEITEVLLSKTNKTYKPKSSFRFFSQFGEDRWIVENLEIPQKGVFIDVGTADGITFSNTYYFEKLGWNGVCIEPDLRNYQKAKMFRKKVLNVAVSNFEGEVNFYQSTISPDLSGLDINSTDHPNKPTRVKSIKLETILKQNKIKKMDLLSIDTEGTELNVWQSFDYKKYKPSIVILEYRTSDKVNKDIARFFKKLPYKQVHKTFSNLIYQLKNE